MKSVLFILLLLLTLVCHGTSAGEEKTLYGFFPSPPEITFQSVLDTYREMGKHGNAVLIQQNIPWLDFERAWDSFSSNIINISNQYVLAGMNNLKVIFVVDPLNGLNRREFMNLPVGWKPSFVDQRVSTAFSNYTRRIVHEFHPKYLGLASEINTWADSHPDDYTNFVNLYKSVYSMVKSISPDTKVFVTFQWDELNNMIPGLAKGRKPRQINWEQADIFEPCLDIWAISSYPFVIVPLTRIPDDYYTPLRDHTKKPLAVGEGGFPSIKAGRLPGSPNGQIEYLKAIHNHIGNRLSFWIYLLINDFKLESYRPIMNANGQDKDVQTLGLFSDMGLMTADRKPKPALKVWDNYRKGK